MWGPHICLEIYFSLSNIIIKEEIKISDRWFGSGAARKKVNVYFRHGLLKGGGGYQLWEGAASYKTLLGPEKVNIGLENTYFPDINLE